jgi:hypothetical protein
VFGGMLAGVKYILSDKEIKAFSYFGNLGKLPELPKVIETLDVHAATEKLRAEEHTQFFERDGLSDQKKAQFYSVRLASNSPTEDNYVYAQEWGCGLKQWQWWGVFDGHA